MKSSTTVLIVGLAVIGIVFFVAMRNQKVAQAGSRFGVSLDLNKAISSIGGFFSGSGKAQSPGTDTYQQSSYAASHDVLDVEGNRLYDYNTGNYAEYGPSLS